MRIISDDDTDGDCTDDDYENEVFHKSGYKKDYLKQHEPLPQPQTKPKTARIVCQAKLWRTYSRRQLSRANYNIAFLKSKSSAAIIRISDGI